MRIDVTLSTQTLPIEIRDLTPAEAAQFHLALAKTKAAGQFLSDFTALMKSAAAFDAGLGSVLRRAHDQIIPAAHVAIVQFGGALIVPLVTEVDASGATVRDGRALLRAYGQTPDFFALVTQLIAALMLPSALSVPGVH